MWLHVLMDVLLTPLLILLHVSLSVRVTSLLTKLINPAKPLVLALSMEIPRPNYAFLLVKMDFLLNQPSNNAKPPAHPPATHLLTQQPNGVWPLAHQNHVFFR